jgi:hypothetical protein
MEHPPRTPRYPFGAPAELLVEHSDAKMLVRVKELSLYGCYLDTAIPLSTKTPVQIKIFWASQLLRSQCDRDLCPPELGYGAGLSGSQTWIPARLAEVATTGYAEAGTLRWVSPFLARQRIPWGVLLNFRAISLLNSKEV